MPTKQAQVSVLDELEQLRGRLAVREARAGAVGPEVEAERAEALTALDAAQDRLARFHAGDPDAQPDPARQRVLREAVAEARAAADPGAFTAKVDGARMAVLDARAELQAFIRDRFLDLAAERLPSSMAAQARLAAALDETEEALDAWAREAAWWLRVMPHANVARSELPRLDVGAIQAALPAQVEVPAPSSLLSTNGRST